VNLQDARCNDKNKKKKKVGNGLTESEVLEIV
jgi:hypothetical protein